jgi:spore coat polysaccharide biosynthesis protein SpsF (cytidylyltransferase family)
MSEIPIPGLVTVRTSSTRLPAKCLLPFGNGNVLEHNIRRARAFGIEPIVCTSVDRSDDILEKIASQEGARCFRGSLSNKLKRWADCAAHFGLEAFHTVDADDPFFDGMEMRSSMSLLSVGGYDIVCPSQASSSGGGSVGYSLTADIVQRASAQLPDEADTEMMWYYLEKIANRRSVVLADSPSAPSKVRLTLDYEEDYWMLESVRRIVGNFAPRVEIDQLFSRNPDLYMINWFRNNEWKVSQLAKQI